MGPKKQQKAKGNEEEDLSTQELLNLYKRFCKAAQIPHSKVIETAINEKIDDGSHLNEIVLQEKIGQEGAIELCRALKACNKGEGYKHLQSIRVWEGDLENQGVGAFYRFMLETKQYKINLLEFMNCNIGVLGCEFLSRILSPNTQFSIKIMTLDYNTFGNEGFAQLMSGLKSNSNINYLSLCYCGLTSEAAPLLKQLVDYQNSSLEKLFLQGNLLENKGAIELLNALQNKSESVLEELNICNTGVGNDPEFIQSFTDLINTHMNLSTYNLKYNLITESEFQLIIEALQAQKDSSDLHIFQIQIDEIYDTKKFDVFFNLLKGRKKKAKKKPTKK